MAVIDPDETMTLTESQRIVLATVKHHNEPVSFERVCVESALDPDVVFHAIAVLLELGSIKVDRDTAETELQLVA